jgi:hypothetical protein
MLLNPRHKKARLVEQYDVGDLYVQGFSTPPISEIPTDSPSSCIRSSRIFRSLGVRGIPTPYFSSRCRALSATANPTWPPLDAYAGATITRQVGDAMNISNRPSPDMIAFLSDNPNKSDSVCAKWEKDHRTLRGLASPRMDRLSRIHAVVVIEEGGVVVGVASHIFRGQGLVLMESLKAIRV